MDIVKEKIELLVKDGVFGPGKLVKIEEDYGTKGPQFASTLKYFKVYMEPETIKEIIVKFQLVNSDAREFMMNDEAFTTEVVMYKEYLPLLGADNKEIFPKFYYGFSSEGKDPAKDIVILEDLRKYGYKVYTTNNFLDKDHVLLAMKKLGEFHALSHLAKKRGNLQFSKLCTTKFSRADDMMDKNVRLSMSRGINTALKKCSVTNKKKLESVLLKVTDIRQFSATLCDPEEPYAVLTHGDFNRNNVLYTYKNNKPVDIKFFDLQTSIYSSPAIDLSFFLYLNTDKTVRKDWNTFLETYWKSLTKCVDPGFSYEQFLDDFGKRAIYGYFICSFFLPVMLEEYSFNPEDFFNMTEEEREYHTLNCGGEPATEALANIVDHLLETGSIDKFLQLKIGKNI